MRAVADPAGEREEQVVHNLEIHYPAISIPREEIRHPDICASDLCEREPPCLLLRGRVLTDIEQIILAEHAQSDGTSHERRCADPRAELWQVRVR